MRRIRLRWAWLCGVWLLAPAAVGAAGTPNRSETPKAEAEANPATEDLYEKGRELAQNEEFEAARSIFEKLHTQDPKNPDVLNMLAYTQRKTGWLDEAVANYLQALKLRPKFPEAQEYLGEAYLQLALRQVEILRNTGSKEETTQLVDAIHAAAAGLEGKGSGNDKSKW